MVNLYKIENLIQMFFADLFSNENI